MTSVTDNCILFQQIINYAPLKDLFSARKIYTYFKQRQINYPSIYLFSSASYAMSKKNKTKLRKRVVSSKKESIESQKRIMRINVACVEKNIPELRKLAITGPGLVDDGLRRLCW